ncbi:putative inorganic phosphate cotransporter isoform X2 [Sipha flava]|uniref:Inorganic phosphate cotransporter isoform X2 n=1 Tax=Sipha flava TaxID=143950 RepID=A0A8B8FSA1_9HEMI|nr:putative inorganic phosphate cotransporter isoform X2 [Sipha flava]
MDKRTILWYMTFWGFAVNYMFRMNINIAIVSMVKHSIKNVTVESECPDAYVMSLKLNNTYGQQSPANTDDNKFEWNEYETNSVLGAFFTLHMIMQIPGGVLAQRYGTKKVYGLSNGVAAMLSCAIPIAAKINYKTLLGVRLVQGFIAGGVWPSMQSMTAVWIPPHERSRFVSAYLGSSFGTAVTYVMCGYLIAMFGWESVYYVTAALGFLWYVAWMLLVYDTPAEHPTISERERIYIESCVIKTSQSKSNPLPIPWKSLILSKALIVNLLAQGGAIWGLFTLTTQAPTYFNFILGLNIKQTGLWSGVPHLFRWMFSFGFSTMCDHIVKSKTMSMTNVRKLATGFSNVLQGLFILGLCYSGCNSTAAVVMLISATAVNGAVSSGTLAAVVDISPNFAGIIQGIVGSFCVFAGFLSPMVVGFLTINQSVQIESALTRACLLRSR